MLFKGPKLNTRWIPPTLSVLVFVASIVVKCVKPLTWPQFMGLLANLEGTVLLASAFDPQIPPHGKTSWDTLKNAILEFPNYGSSPAFDFLRFYLGLFLLLLGVVVTTLAS